MISNRIRIRLSLAFTVLFFALSCEAQSGFSVTLLKTSELDSNHHPELHLLLTGLRGPTKNLRVQTDSITWDFPWSWKTQTADIWLSVGEWKTLTLELTYVDGDRASATLRSPTSTNNDQKK